MTTQTTPARTRPLVFPVNANGRTRMAIRIRPTGFHRVWRTMLGFQSYGSPDGLGGVNLPNGAPRPVSFDRGSACQHRGRGSDAWPEVAEHRDRHASPPTVPSSPRFRKLPVAVAVVAAEVGAGFSERRSLPMPLLSSPY